MFFLIDAFSKSGKNAFFSGQRAFPVPPLISKSLASLWKIWPGRHRADRRRKRDVGDRQNPAIPAEISQARSWARGGANEAANDFGKTASEKREVRQADGARRARMTELAVQLAIIYPENAQEAVMAQWHDTMVDRPEPDEAGYTAGWTISGLVVLGAVVTVWMFGI
jgi:hypothetical protein